MAIQISRILHAGYVFECQGTRIAFDPIFENPFSRNCHAFPEVRFDIDEIKKQKFSAVFISHYHDDHCSLESLNLLDRETPIYMFCVFEEMFSLIRALGFSKVYSLELNAPIEVVPFKITPRRALDADVDSLFQIQAEGVNILNVVDSWIDYETLDLLVKQKPWDLVLWPFQTMRELEVLSPSRATPPEKHLPPEWIEQLQALQPRYLVPSSCQFKMEPWSWYNNAFFPVTYQQFQKEMKAALSQTQVIRMNPSVSIVLDHKSLKEGDPLSWVHPVGEQNLDYEFKSELVVPSTSEIAKRFQALTAEQTEKVLDYCRSGILQHYSFLESDEDVYFSTPRYWRLSIYDHQGNDQTFYFLIHGKKIESASLADGALSWTTEVPLAKLYAALYLGESLTSMYMRINNETFAPEIEKEIQIAEIGEDPLMRSLFNGIFGAYQKAQLKKLKGGP